MIIYFKKQSMDPNEKSNKDPFKEWCNDPSNWKFGVFYFNPKDERIFPPKRLNSLGWTVNFAKPFAIIAIILIIILMLYLVKYFCTHPDIS